MVLNNEQSPQALPTVQRAADLLKPVATAPNAAFAARRAYIEVLGRLGYEQLRAIKTQDGLATLQLAMREADALGARDLTHIDMSAEYAQSAGFQIEALVTLGRGEEARRIGADAGAVAQKVLALRPGYLQALRAESLIAANLGSLAVNDMREEDAITLLKNGEEASRALVQRDPGNTIAISNLGVDLRLEADAQWAAGHARESNKKYLEATEVYKDSERAGASFILNLMNARASLEIRQADVGDMEGARSTQAESVQSMEILHHGKPVGYFVLSSGECLLAYGPMGVALLNTDPPTTRRLGRDCIGRMKSLTPHGSTEEFFKNASIFYTADLVGQAEYLLGDYTSAERTLREGMEARKNWPTTNNGDRREQAEVSTWLAMALARQGRAADAESVIAPVVKLHRELAAQNHDDQWQHLELAAALYAQALTDRTHRAALLSEAAMLVARVPAEMRELRSLHQLRDRIRDEQRAPAVAMTHGTPDRGAG
jgi:tetratricopeptide (TPR) repeat protein